MFAIRQDPKSLAEKKMIAGRNYVELRYFKIKIETSIVWGCPFVERRVVLETTNAAQR